MNCVRKSRRTPVSPHWSFDPGVTGQPEFCWPVEGGWQGHKQMAKKVGDTWLSCHCQWESHPFTMLVDGEQLLHWRCLGRESSYG